MALLLRPLPFSTPFAFTLASASIAALAFAAGCGSSDSSTEDTGSIAAVFGVTADDTVSPAVTTLDATFNDGFKNIIIEGTDTLSASTDKDPSLTGFKDVNTDIHQYELVIPATDRTTVTFALNRTDKTSAPATKVSIPPSAVITSPATVSVGSATDVTLAWSNSDSSLRARLYGSLCPTGNASITATTYTPEFASDDGTATIPLSVVTAGAALPQCVQLRLEREADGTVDPAFDTSKSTVTASRLQTYKVMLTK